MVALIVELLRLYYNEFGMRQSELLSKLLEQLRIYDHESDSD
jgi:hypothetical protein